MIDKELVDGCLRGNTDCQRRLFEYFADKMTTICRRYSRDPKEAQDILQEAFVRVFTGLHQYRFEGPLEAWIRRIVVRTALNTLQKKRLRFSDIDIEGEEIPSPDPDALTAISADELLKLISALPSGSSKQFFIRRK